MCNTIWTIHYSVAFSCKIRKCTQIISGIFKKKNQNFEWDYDAKGLIIVSCRIPKLRLNYETLNSITEFAEYSV